MVQNKLLGIFGLTDHFLQYRGPPKCLIWIFLFGKTHFATLKKTFREIVGKTRNYMNIFNFVKT